jgi:dTMP kinase
VSSAVFAVLVKLAQNLGESTALHSLDVNPERLALLFDVFTFFASAALIASLAIPRSSSAAGARFRLADLGKAWSDLRVGLRYIRDNAVVRGVLLGLACGLGGGGTVVPLGPVFAAVVLHEGPSGFGILLTALGVGVAIGVLVLTLIQRRISAPRFFITAVFAGGISLILAASSATLEVASFFIVGLGLCAGSVYVLGFSMLQSEVDDELRGRIFSTLYVTTRLCLFLALIVAPVMAELLDGLSVSVLGRRVDIGGWAVHLPGVRITLWMGGAIILVAGALARRALTEAASHPAAGRRAMPEATT